MTILKQLAKSMARQGLTTIGTLLATAGYIQPGASKNQIILGATVALASYIWSVTHSTGTVSIPIQTKE